MSRLVRKNDHLQSAFNSIPGRADFSDIHLLNNCLPEIDLEDVSIESNYLGRTYRSPLFINAITGGTREGMRINALLAHAARECGLPMALGSQAAALDERSRQVSRSFKLARSINPFGEIWANLNAGSETKHAQRAVKMVKADALQLHLNVPQELAMAEGDRNFMGRIENIKGIVNHCGVPVVIKEVGFGVSAEAGQIIKSTGASAIDVSGRGGSNFLQFEGKRNPTGFRKSIDCWGIPTAISIIEVNEVVGHEICVFASGGLFEPLDIVKALALGAQAVGVAGYFLHVLYHHGIDVLVEQIKAIESDIKKILIMTGASDLLELRRKPLIITGFTAEWLENRGIDPGKYARRQGGTNVSR